MNLFIYAYVYVLCIYLWAFLLMNLYFLYSRQQPNMKCIVFVNRIITARTLTYILQKLKFLAYWKCHFLVGVHAGLKSMSRKAMKSILEKFRCGEVMLMLLNSHFC